MVSLDIQYSSLTIVFVFFYLFFDTSSFFLAAVGLAMMVFSIPLTIMVTAGFGGITHLGPWHFLAIFSVIIKQSNEMFYFLDVWGTSERCNPTVLKLNDRPGRMAYSIRKTIKSLGISACISVCPFIAGYIYSPLIPVKSLCAFSSVLILVVTYQTIFVFSAAVIFQEDRFRNLFKTKKRTLLDLVNEYDKKGNPKTLLKYTKKKIE